MIKSRLFALAGAFVLLAGAAHAASITNRDVSEHYLQITEETEGSETQDIVISANQSLDGICMNGCMIGLDDGEQMNLTGGENVVIQDGALEVQQ
ncbi:MAG TPA: hypothetical protein VKN63_05450 [Afifellaceae bacterium]|nr:hypothetical protein [Afifellaceae bacterium]